MAFFRIQTSHLTMGLVSLVAIQLANVVHADDQLFDLSYVQRDLRNGLRVIVVPTDYPDIVSLQIPVQTGSRNEVEPGKTGFAHFFEHMMFRGTDRYPADRYNQIIKNAGGDQNAYTTDDYTNYHVTFNKDDLETILELEADRFKNLSYSEEQFRTEALAVKGEYLKNFSNPIRRILERVQDLSFQTHTYKHTTMGFFADIEEMPNQLEYSKQFFDRWYRPEKSVVILVGDLDPDETVALVEKHFGDWQRGNFDAAIPAEPAPTGPKSEHIQWQAPTQPWLTFAFRGPAFDGRTADAAAMDMVAELYFSESSELYKQLVLTDQSVDQLFTYFPDHKDPFLLVVAARLTDEPQAADVRRAIFGALARARTETVDQNELESVKSRLRYGFTAVLSSSQAIAQTLATYSHFERSPQIMNQAFAQTLRLTPEAVRDYANRYFVDQSLVTVTLSSTTALPGMEEPLSLDALVLESAATTQRNVRLVQQPSRQAPLVDVAYVFDAGAADDPPGKKGVAALTALMLTEGGSKRRTIDEINDALYPMAAGFGAQVDKEMIRLSGQVHKDKLDEWYRLTSEQLLDPGWRVEDFQRLKTQLVNSVRTDLVANNDEELGKEALYEFVYGQDHPYGSLTQGHVGDLEDLTLDDVKAFYGQHFTTETATLALAGGYPNGFAQRVAGDLQKLPVALAGPMVSSLLSPPAIKANEALVIQKETPAVAVSFGFPIDVKRGDPDWLALWLARSYLGEHRNSSALLFNRIREARGMNYGNYAYIEYFPRGMFQFKPDANLAREQQLFQIWIRPLRNNQDAHFATRTAVFELQQLLEKGIDQGAFEATRNYLTKYASLLVDTQSRQLGYAVDSDYYGMPNFAQYVKEGLAQLTVDDVNRAIRKHLRAEKMKFVFVTADGNDLKARLSRDRASPISYNSEKPEALLKEDEQIEELPLNFRKITVTRADKVFE
jgi:zinc protease